MKLSKETLESVISEFIASAEKSHDKDHEHDCIGCEFADMLRSNQATARVFAKYITRVMMALDPVQALINGEEMFQIVAGVFMLGLRTGRVQILQEQEEARKERVQ